MGTMKKGILVLDPRTKILLLLGINIYVFTNSYVWAEIIVMAALIILLLLCGVYKAALKSTVTYIALLLASGDNRHSGSGEKRQFWSTENSHLQFE